MSCDRSKCQNKLFFRAVVPDGLQFYSPNCNQVFLVPKDKIQLERYNNYGSNTDCNQCLDSLVRCAPSYDNGFILCCLCCGKFYRLALLDFVRVDGEPVCT